MIMDKCESCIGRTPFASIIGTVVMVIGIAIFCGCQYTALQFIVKDVLMNLFGFNVQWLEVIQVVFLVLGLVMGLFVILLLVFGFLATGATRHNVYSGDKCIMGGRVSAIFFMMMTFIFNIVWMLIMSLSVVPMILYLSIQAICRTEVYNRKNPLYCFRLSQYGVYRNSTISASLIGKDKLCDRNDLQRMCGKVEEAGPLFCVAYAGGFLIVVALFIHMMALMANYTRIRAAKEITEYRNAFEGEMTDKLSMSNV